MRDIVEEPLDDWRIAPIGDLCEAIYDGPHATPNKTDAGPIFLGISNLEAGRLNLTEVEHLSEEDLVRWTRRVVPGAEDVVFSYETRLGEAAMIPPNLRCCLGRRMALMRPNRKKVDPRFLLYAYLGPEFQETIRSRTIHGSTVDRIPLTEFSSFPMRIPSLLEQRAIAHILGTLDDKIELNRRMNATLEEMARALFRSWFVDFDPVRAKAEGRQPVGMDAETAALFPDSFEETELGEVPRGWHIRSLPDVLEINPLRRLARGQVAPYVEMANLPVRAARVIAWEPREFSSGMRFINGDVLLARITPCLENGKTAYVDFLADGEVGWGSTEYIVLHAKDALPPPFAYFLARSTEFRTFAIQNMTGTSGRQRVPAECFSTYLLVIPPQPIAAAFGAFSDAALRAMKQHDEETATLVAIRDSLLPKLLSGEVRVRAVDRITEARNDTEDTETGDVPPREQMHRSVAP